MSLKKVFLNEAHITLAAVVGLLTWSTISIVEKKLQTKQSNKQTNPAPRLVIVLTKSDDGGVTRLSDSYLCE